MRERVPATATADFTEVVARVAAGSQGAVRASSGPGAIGTAAVSTAIPLSATADATDAGSSASIETRSSWWPLICIAVIAVLVLLVSQRRRRKRDDDDAVAKPRAITWSGVTSPDTGPVAGAVAFDDSRWPLPSVSVSMDMGRVVAPGTPVPAPTDVALRHDASRASDSRARAIGEPANEPVQLDGLLPPAPRVRYRLMGMPADPVPAPPSQPTTHALSPQAQTDSLQPSTEQAVREIAESIASANRTAVERHPDIEQPAPVTAAAQAHPISRIVAPTEALAVMPVSAAPLPPLSPDKADLAAQRAKPMTEAHSPNAAPEATPIAANVDTGECLARAKQSLTANRPEHALAELAPVLEGGNAGGEAWTVAGWSWWRIARDQPTRELEAATRAEQAFQSALRAEPDRVDLLSRMIARCHLARARHHEGASRLQCLDEAIAVFDRHLAGRQADDAVLQEWAAALYERAVAAPHAHRAQWLDRCEDIIERRWGRAIEDAGEPVQWLWVNVLLARAELVGLRPAEALHARAQAMLLAGIGRFGDAHRDAWLTRLIDAERAFAQRVQGAARINRLHALQDSVEPMLAMAWSIPPFLSWIGLLGDWAASLQGAAAQAKLREAEPLFARIEQLSPADTAPARFARAYYLRLRSRREFGATRWQTLEQAQTLLASIARGELPEALIDLEGAEVHLEQAALADDARRHAHYSQAALLGEAATQAPENETRALMCTLTALIALAQLPQAPAPHDTARMKALSTRLLDLAPVDAGALRTAAQVRLLDGDLKAASELCEAAWNAGAARQDLLPIWREADSRWARSLGQADEERQWKRLHQSMRMASSTA